MLQKCPERLSPAGTASAASVSIIRSRLGFLSRRAARPVREGHAAPQRLILPEDDLDFDEVPGLLRDYVIRNHVIGPERTLVNSSAGQATGPVGFLRVYDHAFGEIAQGGTRRGANMGVLRVDHPDIEEFITCKTDENQITNFNISVGITDDFMRAVEKNEKLIIISMDNL